MTTLTYLQQAQELIDELPFSLTLTDVTGNDPEVQRAVELVEKADYQIQTMYSDWDFLWAQRAAITTTAGDYDIDPSPGGGIIIAEFDRDSFCLDRTANTYKKLEYLSYRKWRDTYNYGSRENAVPDYFSITPDRTVILEPPPVADKSLTFDYWKAPTQMSAKTDTSPIPDRHHRVVIARAKLWWGSQEDAPEIIADAEQEYAVLLAQLKASQLPGQRRQTRAEAETFVQTAEW